MLSALQAHRGQEPKNRTKQSEFGLNDRRCLAIITFLLTIVLLLGSFAVVVFSKNATLLLPPDVDCSAASSSGLLTCPSASLAD